MTANKYPFQDLSLKIIKGEKWKDIPGLDGYFMISNFGRIKRNEYEQQYSDGRIYQRKPRIIKPVLMEIPNYYVNDSIFFLCGRVTLQKKKTNISIARLVYHLFIKPIKLADHRLLIVTKDRDGRNIRPKNLEAITLNQRQKRIYDLERNISAFSFKEYQSLGVKKSILQNSKQISQYNTAGKKIKTFKSIRMASEASGISQSRIGNIANGIDLTGGGYVWRFGDAPETDFNSLLETKRKHYKKMLGQKLAQYDLSGKRIAQYPTIADAAKATNQHHSQILRVLQGAGKSSGGFVWRKGYGKPEIDLANYVSGEKWRAIKHQKKVIQFSIEMKQLWKFQSVKEAAQSIKVKPSTLSGALTGKQLTCGGYKWRFA